MTLQVRFDVSRAPYRTAHRLALWLSHSTHPRRNCAHSRNCVLTQRIRIVLVLTRRRRACCRRTRRARGRPHGRAAQERRPRPRPAAPRPQIESFSAES
eukprot:1802313-Rhodomonas_salina.2